ncbi:hypothetical protein OH77DRAFT_1439629 [Trametes cingulata]|nr:hypothetical protein OH77DRAFT_1439629 [Trametes cingulata]
MSSDDSELISFLLVNDITSYCAMSAAALLTYYHFMTIHEEVNQLLRPKLTGSFILYMLNRYVPLIVVLYNAPFWSFSTSDLGKCRAQQISWTTLELFQYLIWAVFSSLRVYALRVHVFWAVVIFTGSISPLVINAVTTLWVTYYIDPLSGCTPDDEIPANLILWRLSPRPAMLAILARLPIILADIAVLVITWVTQYADYKNIRMLNRKNSLVTVLLRNDTPNGLMDRTITSLNLLHMLLSILPQYIDLPSNDYFIPENVSIFIEPLNAILVSSFLTDLHNAAQSKTYNQSLSSMGTLQFRVVGSLGSALPAPREAFINEDEPHDPGSQDLTTDDTAASESAEGRHSSSGSAVVEC